MLLMAEGALWGAGRPQLVPTTNFRAREAWLNGKVPGGSPHGAIPTEVTADPSPTAGGGNHA
jgi:hypothetical protein